MLLLKKFSYNRAVCCSCAALRKCKSGQDQLERIMLLVAGLSRLPQRQCLGQSVASYVQMHMPLESMVKKCCSKLTLPSPCLMCSKIYLRKSSPASTWEHKETVHSLSGRNKANIKLSARDMPVKQIHHCLSSVNGT